MELDIHFIDEIICYSKVYKDFLSCNKPCVFSKIFTDSWPCRKLWVQDGQPNWEYLRTHYGQSQVPVANCDEQYFNSHPKTEWKLADYLDYIVQYKNDDYQSSSTCFYLKDWHFFKSFKDIQIYETPIYFSVDWLNEYWMLGEKDDYRFVYIGPKGSWTPFHSDVYGSFSWSANIIGKKKWVFLPPGEEIKLKLSASTLPNDLSEINLVDLGIKFIEFIQNEGEIIFVPSGWYHQVWNLEDTISINHNWFNSANIGFVHECLNKAFKEVEDELTSFTVGLPRPDSLDVDRVLQAHHGMNFNEFRNLLQTVIERRNQGHLKIHSSQSCLSLFCCEDLCCDHFHRKSDIEVATNLLHRLKIFE